MNILIFLPVLFEQKALMIHKILIPQDYSFINYYKCINGRVKGFLFAKNEYGQESWGLSCGLGILTIIPK